jgi:hypothetical protein
MQPLRLGMLGLDTSHCEAFTKLLHDESDPHHIPGARVVAAYPGGSDAFALSRDRVAGLTETLRDTWGVAIRDDPRDLLDEADAFLLESVDGRQHREQFAILAEAGKPVFIDKPLACDAAEAHGILEIARAKNVPILSASALRFAAGIVELRAGEAATHSCETFGPMAVLEDYPGYMWYGIHSAEMLYASLGRGCQRVRTVSMPDCDLIVGEWEDGRLGSVRGTRFEGGGFGATVYRGDGVRHGLAAGEPPFYALLLREVVPFLQGGEPPVAPEESAEVIAFLEAAWTSRNREGTVVPLFA